MLVTILLTIMPTVWGFLCGWPVLRRFESHLVRFVAAWFFGQFAFVWWCFGCATLISPYTSFALAYSAHLGLLVFSLGTLRWYRLFGAPLPKPKAATLLWQLVIVSVCIGISYGFYGHHLFMKEDSIWRSSLYWDFAGQFSMVQTFIWGNNFPPGNELMAGAPLAYHYMFFLWVAVYGAIGMSLVGSMNFISIAAFAAVLVLVAGLAEEFTRSRLVALLALILGLSTSSFKWLDLLINSRDGESLTQRLLAPFITNISPDLVAFTANRQFGYNGNMFNLFYFLQERQLTAGCIILLFSAAVLLRSNSFTALQTAIVGIAFGLTAQWHVYCLISVGAAAGLLLVWEKPRRNLFILAMTILSVAGIQLMSLRMGMTSGEYTDAFYNVPRLDFRFATVPQKYPLSLQNGLLYWFFALGPKLILIPAGLVLLSQRTSRHFKIIVAIVLPAFLFTNSIRLAPLSIYDNHKWIRPALLVSEVATAAALVHLLRHRNFETRLSGWLLLPVLVLSGVFEGYGYFRTQKARRFSQYPSELTSHILRCTNPDSVLVSSNPLDILLAGRRMYYVETNDIPGNVRMDHNFFALDARRRKARAIAGSLTLSEFCSRTRGTPIDYVEMDLLSLNRMTFLFARSICFTIPIRTGNGEWVRLADVDCMCAGPPPSVDSRITSKRIG